MWVKENFKGNKMVCYSEKEYKEIENKYQELFNEYKKLETMYLSLQKEYNRLVIQDHSLQRVLLNREEKIS